MRNLRIAIGGVREVRRGQHGPILLFDNAALRLGITAAGETYQTTWSSFDNMTGIERPVTDVEEYSEPVSWIPTTEFGPADPSGARLQSSRQFAP